jgi:predicted LPLAT superfamily acyltransferase
VIDAKDCSDVYTGVDVAATVQGVEDDTVLPPVAILDEDSLLVLFRDRIAVFPDALRLLIMMLLDNTSSFFCSSP